MPSVGRADANQACSWCGAFLQRCAVRAYARDVLGYDLDEERLVVLQNDLNIGVVPLGTSVISIGGFGPWDGLSSIWVVVKSSRS